jgi:hypothetical protein
MEIVFCYFLFVESDVSLFEWGVEGTWLLLALFYVRIECNSTMDGSWFGSKHAS